MVEVRLAKVVAALLVLTVIVRRPEGVFGDGPARRKYHKVTDCDTRTNRRTRQNGKY